MMLALLIAVVFVLLASINLQAKKSYRIAQLEREVQLLRYWLLVDKAKCEEE